MRRFIVSKLSKGFDLPFFVSVRERINNKGVISKRNWIMLKKFQPLVLLEFFCYLFL